ncbi:hypothetical protein CWATWH8502_3623 [Crocosphaera watsonii WH 8502]|uniref:Uncharacterized protein n=1 Tax=Crocosphaera watsonii WH 8502 TaxID=423474 RepID=T2IAB1_CROWT|nr:hypothetical protein CWATWH8502_3623 [Crocosphaera watsonii WH 8502]
MVRVLWEIANLEISGDHHILIRHKVNSLLRLGDVCHKNANNL